MQLFTHYLNIHIRRNARVRGKHIHTYERAYVSLYHFETAGTATPDCSRRKLHFRYTHRVGNARSHEVNLGRTYSSCAHRMSIYSAHLMSKLGKYNGVYIILCKQLFSLDNYEL